MKVAVRAVCRPEVASGIALAGIAPAVAETGAQAADILTALADGRDRGGVVLIERALYDELPGPARRQYEREGAPILLPFPSPTLVGRARPEEQVLEILRQAIGYRVRLR